MIVLTTTLLCQEAKVFSAAESSYPEHTLFGVTDGKAVGTYLELKFRTYLIDKGYIFDEGNAASGLDFPGLNVDMKVTSIKQPQSSCPFRSIRQKIYGLGYSLIIFVYDKKDNEINRTATLRITDTIYVQASRTADFQMTKGLIDILDNQGNQDDLRTCLKSQLKALTHKALNEIKPFRSKSSLGKDSKILFKQVLMAFMISRHLTADEIELNSLSEYVLQNLPEQGFLTISPALQWRLQYRRVIEKAGTVNGIDSVYKSVTP